MYFFYTILQFTIAKIPLSVHEIFYKIADEIFHVAETLFFFQQNLPPEKIFYWYLTLSIEIASFREWTREKIGFKFTYHVMIVMYEYVRT